MGQALNSPLRIQPSTMALQKVSIIWSSEPMTLGSRRRLDQCWLVVDAKLAVEPSLHRFSRSQLPKGFKALSISHVLEVCSLQAPGARHPGGSSICRALLRRSGTCRGGWADFGSARAVEPSEGAFDDPAPLQDRSRQH